MTTGGDGPPAAPPQEVLDSGLSLKDFIGAVPLGPGAGITSVQQSGSFLQDLNSVPSNQTVYFETIESPFPDFDEDSNLGSRWVDTDISASGGLATSCVDTMATKSGVLVDPGQFKTLFLEALNSESAKEVIQSAFNAELHKIDKKVNWLGKEFKVMKGRVDELESIVTNFPDVTQYEARIQALETKLANLDGYVGRYDPPDVLNGKLIQMNQNLIALNASIRDSTDKLTAIQAEIANVAKNDQLLTIENNVSELKTKLEDPNLAMNIPQPLVNELQTLSAKVNQIENTSNMKLLLVDGIAEVPNESTPELLVETLKGKLDPALKLSDIENARRIGQRNGNKPRTILVEFVYSAVRRRTYLNRMQLARSKTPIYFGEYLTKAVAFLFYKCRTHTKGDQRKLFRTWTLDGQIYICKTKNSKGVPINTEAELIYHVNAPADPVPMAV